MAELKPCPLCGGEAKITELSWAIEWEKTTIVCANCGLTLNHQRNFCYATHRGPATGMEVLDARVPIDPDAVTVWNGRTGEGNG